MALVQAGLGHHQQQQANGLASSLAAGFGMGGVGVSIGPEGAQYAPQRQEVAALAADLMPELEEKEEDGGDLVSTSWLQALTNTHTHTHTHTHAHKRTHTTCAHAGGSIATQLQQDHLNMQFQQQQGAYQRQMQQQQQQQQQQGPGAASAGPTADGGGPQLQGGIDSAAIAAAAAVAAAATPGFPVLAPPAPAPTLPVPPARYVGPGFAHREEWDPSSPSIATPPQCAGQAFAQQNKGGRSERNVSMIVLLGNTSRPL
eukprot:1156305-Pelagomonas_calceolata.AAC.4